MNLHTARRYADETPMSGLLDNPEKTRLALRIIFSRGTGNRGPDVKRTDRLQYARDTLNMLSGIDESLSRSLGR